MEVYVNKVKYDCDWIELNMDRIVLSMMAAVTTFKIKPGMVIECFQVVNESADVNGFYAFVEVTRLDEPNFGSVTNRLMMTLKLPRPWIPESGDVRFMSDILHGYLRYVNVSSPCGKSMAMSETSTQYDTDDIAVQIDSDDEGLSDMSECQSQTVSASDLDVMTDDKRSKRSSALRAGKFLAKHVKNQTI